MPKGAVLSEGSSGENISHFASIRIRVVGEGELRIAAYSLDDVKLKNLAPITMQVSSRIIPTRIVNFMEQRASFQLQTTGMDEVFKINRIVVFMKEVYTSYPGN